MIKKEAIVQAVNRKDFAWFENLFNSSKIKIGDQSKCFDGQQSELTYWFEEHDLYVTLSGVSHSWKQDEWTDCWFSVPYEYKEIRFKKTNYDKT